MMRLLMRLMVMMMTTTVTAWPPLATARPMMMAMAAMVVVAMNIVMPIAIIARRWAISIVVGRWGTSGFYVLALELALDSLSVRRVPDLR